MIRKWLVRVVAWCLRPDRNGRPRLSIEEVDEALRKAYKHRTFLWRNDVYGEAMQLNREKKARKVTNRGN